MHLWDHVRAVGPHRPHMSITCVIYSLLQIQFAYIIKLYILKNKLNTFFKANSLQMLALQRVDCNGRTTELL